MMRVTLLELSYFPLENEDLTKLDMYGSDFSFVYIDGIMLQQNV
jgi:hypothetical protein